MNPSIGLNPATKVASLGERFQSLYGVSPRVFRAPGRVNLIGEHTDYNDGFVMPAAIEFYTWVAIAPNKEARLRVYSEQFGETVDLPLNELVGPPRRHWSDYVRGVAGVLQAAGYELRGADLVISGEVPLGAGLSSSAAIEVSTAMALASVSGLELNRLEIAKLCQRAEHEYTGTRCGIMDQFISAFGHAARALMLDCRSLEYSLLPLPADIRMVICNSMVKHQLASGEYNLRRADCETAVSILSRHFPGITALRDVTPEDVERHKAELPEVVYRRARHVVTENQRVLDAAAALTSGDIAQFGRLMYESHFSLRDDYEVSCEELNILVDIASKLEGVFGARMTGGGFGGCTINMVAAGAVEAFQARIIERYQASTGKAPAVYVCSAAEGAGPVEY